MVAVFIKQLVWKQAGVPQVVSDFYHQYSGDARQPSLKKYISIFLQLAQSFQRIYIIIDALDECKEDERQLVLEYCQTLLTSSTCFRVYITSRREDDIERAFMRLNVPKVQIEARNTKADIQAYVVGQVRSLIANQTLRLKDLNLQQTIINVLIDQAEGM
jgi:hypothetical protein